MSNSNLTAAGLLAVLASLLATSAPLNASTRFMSVDEFARKLGSVFTPGKYRIQEIDYTGRVTTPDKVGCLVRDKLPEVGTTYTSVMKRREQNSCQVVSRSFGNGRMESTDVCTGRNSENRYTLSGTYSSSRVAWTEKATSTENGNSRVTTDLGYIITRLGSC